MPSDIEKEHIKRSRSLWSKTIGVAYGIIRSHGDVYQANYLLQDCYLASRLRKKPLIGYSVGSDLRVSLKHYALGRIVRHNLKNCDKIIVSTPDLIDIAKKYREDAEYIPPAVDPKFFFPKPKNEHSGKKKVLIASNFNWRKGTDIAIKALSKIKEDVEVSTIAQGPNFSEALALASSKGLTVNVLPKVPHQKMNEYLWSADVIIDQFRVGSPGTVVLEAIACNRPAITFVSSAYPEYAEFEPKDVDSEDKIVEELGKVFTDDNILNAQRNYFLKNHKMDVAVQRYLKLYRSLIEE
jgi:glycosyltransferase involved in cell wall biosynthesis